MSLEGEAKKEYQRAYMKRKREKNLSGEGSTQPLPGAAGVAKTEASALTLSEAQGNAAQNNLPGENRRTRGSVDAVERPAALEGELAATTSNESGEWTPATEKSASGQSFVYDKKKYPNRGAWEIAVQRSDACIRYAQMFPHLIRTNDLKFQTIDWWYARAGT